MISSCATLSNSPTVKVNIYSDTDSVKVYVNNDSLNWQALPTSIDVMRSKNNLMVTAQKDTIQKQIEVKRETSTAFWLGNAFPSFFYSSAGIVGYVIDLTSPKRFTYPKTVLLNFNDNGEFSFEQKRDLIPFEKNDIRLNLKSSLFNHLSLNPNSEFREDKFGFVGYGIGLEYGYSKNRFLETSFSFAMTYEWPFPVHIDKVYNKSLFSYYLSTTDNFVCNRFSFGYGINYSVNYWKEWYRDFKTEGLPTIDETSYTNKNLGITVNTYYRIGKALNIGIIYRPSFININNGFEPIYEHLISLEANWRIKLFNVNKKK